MESLEEVELAALADITDAGVAKLASLPRLRRLTLSGRRVTEPKPGCFRRPLKSSTTCSHRPAWSPGSEVAAGGPQGHGAAQARSNG